MHQQQWRAGLAARTTQAKPLSLLCAVLITGLAGGCSGGNSETVASFATPSGIATGAIANEPGGAQGAVQTAAPDARGGELACGAVSPPYGEPLLAYAVSGPATCENAERILADYYRASATLDGGSRGFWDSPSGWECYSPSTQEFQSTGVGSRCTLGDGDNAASQVVEARKPAGPTAASSRPPSVTGSAPPEPSGPNSALRCFTAAEVEAVTAGALSAVTAQGEKACFYTNTQQNRTGSITSEDWHEPGIQFDRFRASFSDPAKQIPGVSGVLTERPDLASNAYSWSAGEVYVLVVPRKDGQFVTIGSLDVDKGAADRAVAEQLARVWLEQGR